MTCKADQESRYWLTAKGMAAVAHTDYCEVHDCERPCIYCEDEE
jgi:hypothetical protein